MGDRQRRFDRIRARLPVRYGPSALDFVALGDNVSEGGLFLNTNEVYKVGTRLLLEIEFPDRKMLHRGEVTWAIRVPQHLEAELVCGMGVGFLALDPGWMAFFRQWKESLLVERGAYSPK